MRPVRLLAAAIAGVILVAVAVVVVQEPRMPSSAAPPPAPAAAAALPAAMAPATSQPSKPPRAPQPGAGASAAVVADHLSTGWGVDVSWPQCGAPGMPSVQPAFVVVGINGGKPFTDNPCLARELAWARTRTGYAAYVNIDAPRSDALSASDAATYGRKVALDGLARAQHAGLHSPVLWLDVEVLNHWSTSAAANVAVINGALRALQRRGVGAGIYSSVAMWRQITGGATVDVPVWLATSVTDYRQLPQWCDIGLGGRPAEMTQYVAWDGRQYVDVDVLCRKAIPGVVREFAAGRG